MISASLGLVLVAVSGLLLLGGLTMIVWAAFMAANHSLGLAPAALLTGLLAILLAGGVICVVTRIWR
jgi:hypothetical protein